MDQHEAAGSDAASGHPECRFCAIIRGDQAAILVFEDPAVVAFLDRRPLFPGHVLVVPREHHETLSELPPRLLAPLFSSTQLLSRAVELGLDAEGSFIAMNNRVSQSVPHLHVHVVPRRRHDGLKGFFWPRYPYRDEQEMLEVAGLIRSAAQRLGGIPDFPS